VLPSSSPSEDPSSVPSSVSPTNATYMLSINFTHVRSIFLFVFRHHF
jgi:hypothetical protein